MPLGTRQVGAAGAGADPGAGPGGADGVALEWDLDTGRVDDVDAMTRIHVRQTAAALRSNRDLPPLVDKGDLTVVSAYYSLDTGRVEVLTGAPPA
ncbi:carbonic anhydrase [Streptomyces umbrinus]|uniref:Carbonic anhydrase n=1 Tax=Streptomyces umbrinus TaxID=67370 RepID=A0ABU0T8N3_9ACTN|nr:hypothetical protein [Streptomyces umbrinus]MDQ1032166.1 carbonic anhydrase [Streptomyces umbrinus]